MNFKKNIDLKSLKKKYDNDGFVVIKSFLSKDDVNFIKNDLKNFISNDAKNLKNRDINYTKDNKINSIHKTSNWKLINKIHKLSCINFISFFSTSLSIVLFCLPLQRKIKGVPSKPKFILNCFSIYLL